jgi:hypothetical protein
MLVDHVHVTLHCPLPALFSEHTYVSLLLMRALRALHAVCASLHHLYTARIYNVLYTRCTLSTAAECSQLLGAVVSVAVVSVSVSVFSSSSSCCCCCCCCSCSCCWCCCWCCCSRDAALLRLRCGGFSQSQGQPCLCAHSISSL